MEISMEAVKQNGEALDYVPEEFRDMFSKTVVVRDWTEKLNELKMEISKSNGEPPNVVHHF
jgi:predicted Zn-dependent protease with MMP-like domain